MDLLLWRHAEAVDHPELEQGRQGDALDLARRLTPRGEKQAARMAAWLDRQLPDGARIFASPAQRTEQTALALGRRYKLRDELAPEGDPADLLTLVQWPHGKSPTLVVGHQPTLGRVIARLLGLPEDGCPMKKGAVWWLRQRERNGRLETVIVTVQTPELL
ncbi:MULTISPECIES: SixA phosphatase family protein [Hydrogenophaga]|uniref:Histidine phosphatase family protein n=1 Tax=Hydrogenophaga electricum TaxID=1230953 RepID=A0ABQ6C6W6_9BURK|nr:MULTISPECIES: histidine phosphatase family protein [Hydrogenophaga]GLS14515.1 histidine phosphatase family protein [Hydrogenophaga electricum]